tara:strand:+ start:139 stop:1569 length:1431 start_codon:yes stop_codon:yes gene_type:complete
MTMIRHMQKALTACALVLTLGACTVGPDYAPPELNAPAAFVSQDVLDLLNDGKTDAGLKTEWWTGFHDPTLNQLVAEGIADNQTILSAAARVEQFRENVNLSASGDDPVLDASGGVDISRRETLGGDDDSRTSTGLSAGLGLLWPFDVFGRTRRNTESARAALEAAEADLRDTILSVSVGIAAEYLQYRGNERQLELLRESVALQEKTLSIVQSRFKFGIAPELDYQRAITSVENLRADIPPLEQSLVQSRNRLATLTGQYSGHMQTDIPDDGDIPGYNSLIPEVLPLDVINHRPDVQFAEAALKQAVAEIGVAEAEFYPAFNLNAGLVLSATGGSGLSGVETLIATLGAAIDQTLLDGGRRQANLNIARAAADEALYDYRQVILLAVEDVEAALSNLKASRERQIPLEKAVAASGRSFQQAEILYREGLISFLDVVDAQRVLASAEQQLARERTQYAVLITALFQSLGVPVDSDL